MNEVRPAAWPGRSHQCERPLRALCPRSLRRRLGRRGGAKPFETIVTPELAKSIISTNQSPDISFDQSINPYRGCEHGCIYCYARPNHAYVGLSPGSISRPSCS